ncbi:hypothetical protein ABLE68_17035 [Nocardioides sp. CN2-186]|uniref:hypothetical protein n=1 Tax=Nocardioides tweenelious TaxID=3156607 RepID=UPI0032B45A8E
MSELLAEEIFRKASESIDVLAPPLQGVVDEARAQRRRRRRVVAASVAAAVVVVAGLTWIGTRPPAEPDGIGPAKVTRATNPVDVGWYAAGKLHLDKVTVTVPDLTDFGEVNGGAVYGDRAGHVAFVDAQGEQRLIGTKAAGVPVVVSVGTGWAAWIEPVGNGGRIVVWDAVAGATLAELPVGRGVRLIAIDQDHVFYETPAGDYGWTPPNGEPVLLDRSGLIEVESATKVYQEGKSIDMVQPFFSVDYKRPGIDAILSPGGYYAVSSSPANDGTPPFKPLLYDVRSGKSLPTGFAADDFAIDATFGDNHSVVYLVIYSGDIVAPHPLVVLRTCELGAARCSDVVPLSTNEGMPILGS